MDSRIWLLCRRARLAWNACEFGQFLELLLACSLLKCLFTCMITCCGPVTSDQLNVVLVSHLAGEVSKCLWLRPKSTCADRSNSMWWGGCVAEDWPAGWPRAPS